MFDIPPKYKKKAKAPPANDRFTLFFKKKEAPGNPESEDKTWGF